MWMHQTTTTNSGFGMEHRLRMALLFMGMTLSRTTFQVIHTFWFQ